MKKILVSLCFMLVACGGDPELDFGSTTGGGGNGGGGNGAGGSPVEDAGKPDAPDATPAAVCDHDFTPMCLNLAGAPLANGTACDLATGEPGACVVGKCCTVLQ
jgi:hypothetical protein